MHNPNPCPAPKAPPPPPPPSASKQPARNPTPEHTEHPPPRSHKTDEKKTVKKHPRGQQTQKTETLSIQHPQWKDEIRIHGTQAVRSQRPDKATARHRNKNVLTLEWEHWGKEEFLKTGKNKYQHLSYSLHKAVSEAEKYSQELLINPCAWNKSALRHIQMPLLGIGYDEWEFLHLLDRMYEDIETQIRQMPHLKQILIAGMCKDALAALQLALRLQQGHPHLRVGALGCPWPVDSSGASPVYKGILLSPAHAAVMDTKPYRTQLTRYGNALTTLERAAASGRRIHIFGYYTHHPVWEIDRHATERLEPFLCRKYTFHAGENENFANIHGKALRLAKQNPGIIKAMFADAMHLLATTRPDQTLAEKELDPLPAS